MFPTRVSLTTITLYYYSDSVRGLPRLRFYAVPDHLDIWTAPRTSCPHADVALASPGGEPAGHRSVSINISTSTQESADALIPVAAITTSSTTPNQEMTPVYSTTYMTSAAPVDSADTITRDTINNTGKL